LKANASLGPHEEIFEGIEAAEIERVLAEIAAADVTAWLTRAGDLVRARSDVPPFPLVQRQLLPRPFGFVAACMHRALTPVVTGPRAVGNLMSWQGANYIVADGMVYWPVRVEIDPSILFRDGSGSVAPDRPKAT
jgi:hypothetical protein